MIEFFYDIQLLENDKKSISTLKDNIISPAELGKIMFENIHELDESDIYVSVENSLQIIDR